MEQILAGAIIQYEFLCSERKGILVFDCFFILEKEESLKLWYDFRIYDEDLLLTFNLFFQLKSAADPTVPTASSATTPVPTPASDCPAYPMPTAPPSITGELLGAAK